MEILLSDFGKNLPLFVLICTVLIAIVAEAARKTRPVLIYYISLAGSALTAVLALFSFSDEGYSFSGMIQYGGYAAFFAALFNFIAFVTIILSRNYFESNKYHRGEFYILLLFSVIGMMLIASANDLIIIFLGIELMSFCLYALVGFLRTKERSNEASLKYFLLGAFTTGFLLYGIALIYGVAGTTNLTAIRDMFATISSSPLFFVGTGLLMIGISFKAAAVPFHMWVPDVYEGAPTPITGFMSTAAKAAAFAAFVIVFIRVFEFISGSVNEVIAILAAASMIIGNVIAVSQDNIKRMMAYSSIAHAGYMLCGVAAGTPDGQIGILYYLVAYAMMNLGVFAIISFIEQDEDKNLLLDDYRGLRQSQPLLSAESSSVSVSSGSGSST